MNTWRTSFIVGVGIGRPRQGGGMFYSFNVQIELELRSVGFCGGRKTLGARREPTNSTTVRRWVRESNPSHRGGKGALIHCATRRSICGLVNKYLAQYICWAPCYISNLMLRWCQLHEPQAACPRRADHIALRGAAELARVATTPQWQLRVAIAARRCPHLRFAQQCAEEWVCVAPLECPGQRRSPRWSTKRWGVRFRPRSVRGCDAALGISCAGLFRVLSALLGRGRDHIPH